MDRVMTKLTVFFEEPFWVGVFEKTWDEKVSVSKFTFGTEPKDYEIYHFIGSIIFFVGLPPRNVLICYATLDRMEKQCCSFITDGEELKNNLLFLRQAT